MPLSRVNLVDGPLNQIVVGQARHLEFSFTLAEHRDSSSDGFVLHAGHRHNCLCAWFELMAGPGGGVSDSHVVSSTKVHKR
jgi:hypothetical protein